MNTKHTPVTVIHPSPSEQPVERYENDEGALLSAPSAKPARDRKDYDKSYYQANRETRLKHTADYYASYRGEILKRAAERYQENRKEKLRRANEYSASHKGERRQYAAMRSWWLNNTEEGAFRRHLESEIKALSKAGKDTADIKKQRAAAPKFAAYRKSAHGYAVLKEKFPEYFIKEEK